MIAVNQIRNVVKPLVKYLLRIKHWQFFCVGTLFAGLALFPNYYAYYLSLILSEFLVFSWLLSVVTLFAPKTKYKPFLPFVVFRINFFIIIGYTAFTISRGKLPALHLYATFAIFYMLAVAAKIIGNHAKKNSLVLFFFMWFLPVSIWFVQPKINQMYWELFKNDV